MAPVQMGMKGWFSDMVQTLSNLNPHNIGDHTVPHPISKVGQLLQTFHLRGLGA